MTTIETLRVRPALTTDRVVVAWVEAHPVVRRAVLAATVTSGALGSALHMPHIMGWSVAVVGAVLAMAALVDMREHKLPNRLLGAAAVLTCIGVLSTASAAVMFSAVSGMVLAGGLMLLVRAIRGVGMGDVKMAAVVGASTGATALMAAPLAIAVAAFAAALYGLVARRQRLPLGPALWAGWALSLAAVAAGWLS
jgi:leader peptidase (prepilin peptidase)/N-methyltransferase